MWKRFFPSLLLASLLWLGGLVITPLAQAQAGQVLGIHILNPHELDQAAELLSGTANSDQWRYVTIPLSLADVDKASEWQEFFNQAKTKKIIPVVRLTTRFENGAWQVPTRRDIITQLVFLKKLNWPTEQRYVIVFNEVNHSKEWGGQIDPVIYADVLSFTADWAHAEQANFVVLPAAMDLAAPNGGATREAFAYWRDVLAVQPDVLTKVDVWNSHSYPNPGFSSSPQRTAQNSLRGFEHELAFVKEKTGRDLKVIITETGWVVNKQTSRWLESYYTYALQHIWSNPQVMAVTPFVLRGSPGPFSGFSFLDGQDKPTAQYTALQRALTRAQGGT